MNTDYHSSSDPTTPSSSESHLHSKKGPVKENEAFDAMHESASVLETSAMMKLDNDSVDEEDEYDIYSLDNSRIGIKTETESGRCGSSSTSLELFGGINLENLSFANFVPTKINEDLAHQCN